MIQDYLKTTKRLSEILDPSIFWLSNNQINELLAISDSTRKRTYKTLKELGLLPEVNLKGLNINLLEILWEYRQLVRLTDPTNAYLQIKSIIKELRQHG